MIWGRLAITPQTPRLSSEVDGERGINRALSIIRRRRMMYRGLRGMVVFVKIGLNFWTRQLFVFMNKTRARGTQRIAKPWGCISGFVGELLGRERPPSRVSLGDFCAMGLITTKECWGAIGRCKREPRTPSRTRLDSRMGKLKDQPASEQTHHATSRLPKGEQHAGCWTPKGREGTSGVSRRGDLVQISAVEDDPIRYRVSARDDGITRK